MREVVKGIHRIKYWRNFPVLLIMRVLHVYSSGCTRLTRLCAGAWEGQGMKIRVTAALAPPLYSLPARSVLRTPSGTAAVASNATVPLLGWGLI